MQEQQRHQYLEAMGIPSWLPRQHLAGAKPTPDWVWDFVYPEADDAGTSAPDQSRRSSQQQSQIAAPVVTAAAAKQARADLAASFSAPGTEKAVRADAESVDKAPKVTAPVVDKAGLNAGGDTQAPLEDAAEVVIASAAETTQQAPFKLAFMTYGDCLVVDSLPPRSRQGVSAHHQTLLAKIQQSIGLQGGEPSDLFMLPWPMFASKSLDQGADQARITVQHKLTRSLQSTPVQFVLLLGEAAAQMVLERSEPLEQLRGLLFSLRSDVKTLATASLTEMMTVPGCKREVWMDLQPLLQHIEKAQS